MTIRILFILLPFSVFGQLTNTRQIIYKAQATEVITASFSPIISPATLSVKSTQQIYDEATEITALRVHEITLDSGEVIIAKGANINYTLEKNGVSVNYTPATDNTLSNIKTLAQSAVGVQIGSLTNAQVRALLAVLLWKAGGIKEDGTINKLNYWAK